MHTLHHAVHILSLLLRISPAEPHNNHLWFIIQPDIDRVGPKSPPDDHPALFSSFSRKFKISRTARIKELVLGCHDSAHKRKPDGSAMKMSGKCEIRSPRRILLKKQRRMGQKKTELFRVRLSQGLLQKTLRDLSRPRPIGALWKIQSIDPDIAVEIRRLVGEITDSDRKSVV